jgi:hypothetical protein
MAQLTERESAIKEMLRDEEKHAGMFEFIPELLDVIESERDQREKAEEAASSATLRVQTLTQENHQKLAPAIMQIRNGLQLAEQVIEDNGVDLDRDHVLQVVRTALKAADDAVA